MQAEVAQEEPVADQPARGGGDDDGARLAQGLYAGGKAWRIPNHDIFTQCTLTAHHHQAAGDANADRERLSSGRLELRNGGNNIESRAYGSLGIVLMGTRVAEIGQDPVATEFGKEAVRGQRNTGASRLKGVDDRTHVFRIEARRQSSRVHEIADHHRQVTPLPANGRGVAALRTLSGFTRDGRTGRVARHRPDGPDETFPVAQRDPERFEIAFRQLRQHVGVDGVLDERRFVPFEPQASQPATDVHGRALITIRIPRGCHSAGV